MAPSYSSIEPSISFEHQYEGRRTGWQELDQEARALQSPYYYISQTQDLEQNKKLNSRISPHSAFSSYPHPVILAPIHSGYANHYQPEYEQQRHQQQQQQQYDKRPNQHYARQITPNGPLPSYVRERKLSSEEGQMVDPPSVPPAAVQPSSCTWRDQKFLQHVSSRRQESSPVVLLPPPPRFSPPHNFVHNFRTLQLQSPPPLQSPQNLQSPPPLQSPQNPQSSSPLQSPPPSYETMPSCISNVAPTTATYITKTQVICRTSQYTTLSSVHHSCLDKPSNISSSVSHRIEAPKTLASVLSRFRKYPRPILQSNEADEAELARTIDPKRRKKLQNRMALRRLRARRKQVV